MTCIRVSGMGGADIDFVGVFLVLVLCAFGVECRERQGKLDALASREYTTFLCVLFSFVVAFIHSEYSMVT